MHGASDRTGGLPALHPGTPGNIISTIYQQLGIALHTLLRDSLDVPRMLVPRGRAIDALLV